MFPDASTAWAEILRMKGSEQSKAILAALHAGTQEEIRLRAAMMAAVDEGVGTILQTLEKQGQLDNTFILFFSDNGYFFGEHGLGPERRFASSSKSSSPPPSAATLFPLSPLRPPVTVATTTCLRPLGSSAQRRRRRSPAP
mgnify:CR=1 FL=1